MGLFSWLIGNARSADGKSPYEGKLLKPIWNAVHQKSDWQDAHVKAKQLLTALDGGDDFPDLRTIRHKGELLCDTWTKLVGDVVRATENRNKVEFDLALHQLQSIMIAIATEETEQLNKIIHEQEGRNPDRHLPARERYIEQQGKLRNIALVLS